MDTTGEQVAAKPFIKWAGGKTQLLSQFAAYYPNELSNGKIKTYIEPFLGGGAVFLDIAQSFSIEQAYLSDVNAELILVYKVVQRDPLRLLELLSDYHDHYYSLDDEQRKQYFYGIRDGYNEHRFHIDYSSYASGWIERAAHMIFLNKTCFNGLYRLNSSGKFNVPFGRYKRPNIYDKENILRVSELLQNATLSVGGFTSCEQHVDSTSFVYFDPPYRPLNTTSSFTSYSKDKFDDTHQTELARFFQTLDSKYGAMLMLSNSDPKNVDPDDQFFEDLYGNFHIHRVHANRMINSAADKRGKISELLITNYCPSNG